LILRGARQVGKTYSLINLGENHFANFHYLNFEQNPGLAEIFEPDLDPLRIIKELSWALQTSIDIHQDLLIIDEVQECKKALTSLKYFCEQLPQLAVCAAGSLLGIGLNDSSFPVGKVEFLQLYPMSFEEFLLGIGEESDAYFLENFDSSHRIPESLHLRLWSHFKTYLIVGGLPAAVETYRNLRDKPSHAFQQVRKLQKDLITSYIADMAKHSGKLNSMHLERLFSSIPSQLAREQDGSASKFRIKGAIPGIRSYERLAGIIDWLEKAGLIIRVKIVNCARLPLSAYTKENFFKLYCFDIGILGALAGIEPHTLISYQFGSYKGYVAENFVAQEFLSSGIEKLYNWKERTAELEFLLEINGEIIPVEIKSGWVTQAKSLKVYRSKYNPPLKIIISGRPLEIDDQNGIRRYPLYLARRATTGFNHR